MSHDTPTDDGVANVSAPAADSTETAADPEHRDTDDGLASLEEHTLQRTDEGELQPRRVSDIDELDGADVICKPMTNAERTQYIENLIDESVNKTEVTDAELAELFDSKIVAPDLTQHELCQPEGVVTERFVTEGLTGKQEDGYYIAILLASGEDDMVRRMRGELSDDDLRALIAQEHGTVPGNTREGDGFRDAADSKPSRR